MKTLIAIPCMDTLPVPFAESLLNLIKPPQTAVCFRQNSLIYDSRNILALTAIENGFDRVLWLDSDMDVPMDALKTLSNDMDQLQCDMVTGIYFKRKTPTEPVLYEKIQEPELVNGQVKKNIDSFKTYEPNSLFPVAGCGFGCVLTSVDLLKAVWDKYQNAFLPFPWAGEDISFCYRVNRMGRKIYCDSSVSCKHIGQYAYTEQDFIRNGGDTH